jgi:cell division protein ZapA (FtsZ GTPase activity inhibitor)
MTEGRGDGGSPARVRVSIDGDTYVLRSDVPEARVQACADMVDQRIREIREQGGSLEPHRVALLAALGLAHDLLDRIDRDGDGARMRAERLDALAARLESALDG